MNQKKPFLIFCLLIAFFAALHSAYASDTSIIAATANVTDFSFASHNFVMVTLQLFNTTQQQSELTLMIAANLEKITGGGHNEILARILVDDVLINEQNLARIESKNDIIMAGFQPIKFNVSAGFHNISAQMARKGGGMIKVTNVDMRLVKFVSAHSSPIRNNITEAVFDHSSTNFIPAFNFTVNKSIESPTFFLAKQVITSTTAATADYFFNNLDSSINSSHWSRYQSGSSDIGAVSGFFILNLSGTGIRNNTIQSRTSAGIMTSNITILDFDLADSNSNMVNSFGLSSDLTNLTSNVSYGNGVHNILNATVTVYNGTGYLFGGYAVIQSSSGKQTPRVFINSSEVSESVCYSKKDRYLSADEDVGTLLIRAICDNLDVGNNYTLNMWLEVPSGETVVLIEERLGGFEVTRMDISAGQLPPLPNEIASPPNGANVSGVVNITWNSFDDPNGDNVAYNISLLYPNQTFNEVINSSTAMVYQTFNSSDVIDGNWIIRVEGCDPGGLCSNSTSNFTIDNAPPSLVVQSPSNGSAYSSTSVQLDFSAADATTSVDSCWYRLNSGANTSIVDCANISIIAPEGSNSLTVSVNDSANNINSSSMIFTVSIPQTASPLSGGGGSGGGFFCGNLECTKSLSRIMPGSSGKFEFPLRSIKSIELFAAEKISYPAVTVKYAICENKLKNSMSFPANEVIYDCLEIDAKNLGERQVDRVYMTFLVNKQWIDKHDLNPENIMLKRFDGVWTELPTKLSASKADYFYFVAKSPGLSYFAIVGKKIADESAEKRLPAFLNSTNMASPGASLEVANAQKHKNLMEIYAISAVSFIIAVLGVLLMKALSKKKKWRNKMLKKQGILL